MKAWWCDRYEGVEALHWRETPTPDLAHVVAQSETDAERFRALGARPVTVSGNLKADSFPPPAPEGAVETILAQIGNRKRWAAISTHEGEEMIAAEVHQKLKTRYPGRMDLGKASNFVKGMLT